jgi:hypothetical protein
MNGSGACDATVRNGTNECLSISVTGTDDGSALIDTTLTLSPAETTELDPSADTFECGDRPTR